MSFLFHLPLRGLGTVDVEALGSYIHRLAEAHGVSVNQLLKYAFKWYQNQNPDFRQDMPAIQSNGSLAVYVRPNNATQEMVDVLSCAASAPELRSGTFLALNDTLHRSTGVFSKHFRWCPSCMKEFIKSGDPGYFKLIWHLNDITNCHIHGDTLTDSCPHCGSHQDGYGPKKSCTHCQKCNQPLLKSHYSIDNQNTWELHGADLIDLVDEISRDPNLLYPSNSVRHLVSELYDRAWNNETHENLWKLIPRDDCIRIDSGNMPVTMIVARRTAFRLGMKLTDLLWGDIEQSNHILDPSWTDTLPEEISPKKRRRVHDRDAIFEKLVSILNQPPAIFPSLAKIASETGTSDGYLKYRFPILSKRIIERYQQWKIERRLEMENKARDAALKYFTEEEEGSVRSRKQAFREIRKRTGLPKHLLRKEINAVYSKLFPNSH